MPSAANRNIHHDAYVIACGRVMTDVMGLIRAQGLAVSVDIDPGRAPSESTTDPHKIHLTYEHLACAVAVDHETFVSGEFFRTLVLHQIEAAIKELALSASSV